MNIVGPDGELVWVRLHLGGSLGYLKGPRSGQTKEESTRFGDVKWKAGG